MSSLMERLNEAQTAARPAFELWLAELPAEDLKALEKAAANNGLSSKKLLAIVRAEGASIGEAPFKEWRIKHGFAG